MKAKVRLVPVAYVTIGLFGYFLAMYMLLRDGILEHYHLSETMSGIMVALLYLGLLIMPLVVGELSDRKGKAFVVRICYALIIAGSLLCALASQSALVFAIGIFFCGCGYGAIEGTLSAMLCDDEPSKANRHMNMSQCFFSVGAVVSPMLSRVLVDAGVAWNSLFLGNMALIAVLFALFLFVKQRPAEARVVVAEKGLVTFKLLKKGVFLLLFCGMLLYAALEESTVFWQEAYITGISDTTLGALSLTLFWAAMIPSRFLASFVKSRRYIVIAVCLAFSIAFLGLGIILSTGVISVACFTVAGFFMGPLWPMTMSVGADLFPESSGTALNLLMAACGVGGIVFPVMAGASVDVTGLDYAPFILAIIAGALCLAAAVANRSLIKRKGSDLSL